MEERSSRYIVTVYVGSLSEEIEALSVEASKHTTAEEIVSCIAQKLGFPNAHEFELAEVIGNSFGQECKERRISSYESPVALKLLWPKIPDPAADGTVSGGSGGSSTSSKTSANGSSSRGCGGGLMAVDCYRFCLREKLTDSLWNESFVKDTQFIRDYFYRFHFQPKDKEYPDLCQLPDLNESTLLESLRSRFNAGHIYTYVGSILIAVNPFKFHPIYNPKYVKLYQNRRREELPPHIFAIADSAYHTMLKDKRNQCIVISGESGSGKTESTNFLLHHLTALSQKGTHGSGVEQTILSAGPVLEAFGNAKTAHNNNSSRFGKFIQVSYKENGMVHGSIVQKFLLEKSRICCQAIYERNYHVFYYLLAGASDTERELFNLLPPECYHYLNQSGCYTLDGVDESYEFSRLKQSMEMVGFGADKQRKLFSVLSAVLLLGNVKFLPKKSSYRDESVVVKNVEVVSQISSLLRVTQETLLASLTSKRARVSGEMLVINYRMVEAVAARDAMAKCLYGALFDWIVMQLNHALLSKKSPAGNYFKGKSIGVLDIFGFEDFDNTNSFEQFCINYANEHLQHYFNQHVFKYEQEEYKKEGIKWTNIEFLDNSPCLSLIESKPSGLICILDDQCSFPGATSDTLLQKFNSVYKEHKFYEAPQKREAAFIICHYAGKVKYQVSDFREKNMDLMRHDIVSVLKNSSCAFVRELVGVDPVAVFRWAILRAFFRAHSAFNDAGRRRRESKENGILSKDSISPRERRSSICKDQPVRKNRSFRSQALNSRNLKNLRSVKTLAGHLAAIGVSNKHYNPRKQPISVSQQFQQSLHSLMVTLNQANPFFIRCIKSNSDKIPNEFDDAIVQRQLRYTGMLETVRIRQAGYNVRLNFDEFVHLYRILLPKGLKSERSDVAAFLHSVNLNPLNYQLGEHKVFLRETEKIKLDYFLHQQILKSIVCIQRWYRSILERRHFLRVQQAVVSIQSYVRMFLVQKNLRMMHLAATYIQKTWRGFKVRRWYQNLKNSCAQFQARVRGNIVRENCPRLLEERRKQNLANVAKNVADMEMASDERSKEFSERGSTRGSGEESFFNVTRKTPEVAEERLYRTTESDGASISVYDESTANGTYLERGFSPRTKWEDADDNANIFESPTKELKGSQKQSVSSRSPFQRAKKTIKTIIIPGGGALKTKPEKYEATVLENASEDEDDYLPPNFSTLPGSTSRLRRDPGKLKLSPSAFLTSTEDEAGTSRKALPLRQTRSLQTVSAEKMTETKNFGGTPLHMSESFPYEREVTPPCGERGNGYETETLRLRRQSFDKQTRRQGQVLDEMPPPRNGFDTFRSSGNSSRRESDEKIAIFSSEPRRSSRESEQNYYGSPSLSSQESLAFHRGSVVSGEFKESKSASRLSEEWESRLSTSASEFSLDTSSMSVMGSANQRRKSKDSTKEPGAVKFSLPESLVREVRRSRSVSVSRDAKGGISTDGSRTDQNQETMSREDPRLMKLRKYGYHVLEKVSKFHRGDSCGVCRKTMHAVLAQGQRCTECRTYFHDKCISNGSIANAACEHQNKNHMLKITTSKSETMGRKVKRKESKHLTEVNKSNFSLTGTSEFTDATDQIISDVNELQAMQEFISEKILQVENMDGKKSSAVDKVFEQALREFKESLVSSFSVASKQGGIMLSITYKDLIAYFAKIMETVCKQKGIGSDFPTNMGVNALRGFLNEFMSTHRNRMEEKPKIAKSRKKLKRGKRQKVEEFINYINHTFVPMVVYIPTACEICSSFIMWPIERGIVCQKCKLACHKKCYPKLQIECGDGQGGQNRGSEKGVFGVPLTSLLSGGGSVPLIIEKLIYLIETNGIKQEGIYRKSGVSSRVKELKNEINEGKEVQWDAYNIHVYTSVLKSFFRDMPEPLLTYELYDEFLRAADLSLPEGRIHTIFALLQKLPNPNYDLMERLIFHLVRVAHYEDSNRMNANSLAIVFAPCVLRTNKTRQVLESLTDVSRQTLCIETIIGEQLKKYKSTLTNIEKVDSESLSFIVRLSSVRKSKIMAGKKALPISSGGSQNAKTFQNQQEIPTGASAMTVEEEEAYLSRHLNHLKQEKAILTSALPSLSRAPSEDEMLSTDPEMESSRGSIDDLRKDPSGTESHSYGKHSVDVLDICHECLSPQCRGTSSSTLLPHHAVKTKNRGPLRKPPSRFVRNQFHAINFGEDEFDDAYDFDDELNETRGQSDDDDEDGAMVV